MKLILNEKEYIKKVLDEGYIDEKKPTSTIKILIKHYFMLGMDKQQVRQAVEDFLKRNLKRFNSVKWAKMLDKLVKNEEKQEHKLIVIDKIHITKKELDIISSIGSIDLEKLAFTYLVYSKIYNRMNNNDSNWVNASRKDIFHDSKIVANTHKQRLMVNDLINLGLIESSKRRNCGNKKVLFVDNYEVPEMIITDFREFVYEYLKWKGEKIKNCDCCGRLIKITGKNHKMCRECWKKNEKEIKRRVWHENKQKYRR